MIKVKIISKIIFLGIGVLVAIFFINATFQLLSSSNKEENNNESILSEENDLESVTEDTAPPNEFVLSEVGDNVRYEPSSGIYYHSHDQSKMYDDFSNWPPWTENREGVTSPNGKWEIAFKGGGFIDVMEDFANPNNKVMVLEPEFVTNGTRAPLILTSEEFTNFKLSLDVRTDKQLRPQKPNPWEMAWVLWRYVDDTHFNYFLLKQNGTECGKYDGGINPIDQLFICDSEFPTTHTGKWDHWDIIVKDNHIIILVNGRIVHDFDDASSFDTGKIGLYNEDARTSFDNVTIIPLD